MTNQTTRIERFSFSVRLKGIFFPLSFNDIVLLVEKVGFNLAAALKEKPSLPPGAQIIIGGRIAEKGELRFYVDPERAVIGVDGPNIENVLSEFDAIQKSALEQFAVDLRKEKLFYELIAELLISTGKDPIDTASKLFSDSKFLSTVRGILGDDAANYGVRLVKKGQEPRQEEWWEYRIEPLLAKARNAYYSNIVFRSQEQEKVVKAASGLIETVNKLISTMEQS